MQTNRDQNNPQLNRVLWEGVSAGRTYRIVYAGQWKALAVEKKAPEADSMGQFGWTYDHDDNTCRHLFEQYIKETLK